MINNPQKGFELVVKLSQMRLEASQSRGKLFNKTKLKYASEVVDMTISSQLIALNFHTIATANNYWK
ncbi:hexameric tyrosine-coordinated heme protein [Aquimarina acroporae]|uniref:hexameric tyrosine-coordinated heme protein n=1 Tax=Aquimarina acroporae TaxID=2937283 RepID=UPI00293F3428|nr:hexameric tyrosine-coordinated heme protein [Aquimarina acroporae]